MKKGKVEKKPPDILSARGEAYGGKKNKVLENRKIFYFPVR